MLKFMDGFDQFLDIPITGTGYTLAGLMNVSGYTLTGEVKLDEGRVATTRALLLGDGGSKAGSVKRTFTTQDQMAVIGFAYRAETSRDNVVAVTSLGTLGWNKDTAKMTFAGGQGSATILLDLWYYYEIVVDKANQLVQVWINNTKDIEVALPSTAQFLTNFECLWSSAANDKKYLDDLYFLDGSAGQYTERVGPMAIQARLPTEDIDKEWSPSTGSVHWDLVNNQPPKDGEYVQSNISGAMDTYRSNQTVPTDGQVIAVGITVMNRKSDIDARQLGMVVGGKGQTQKEVIDTDLLTTPKYSYAVFETAPDGSTWTATSVTNTPFGVAVRP